MTLLALAWLGGAALAAAPDPAAERSATVALRALAYDRELKARADGAVDLWVVRGAAPTAHDDAVLAAFQKLSSATVAGLSLRVTAVPWTDAASLAAALDRASVEAVWLGDGLDTVVPEVLPVAREVGAVTLTDREADVRAGVALGVVIGADQRPTIFVNVGESQAQGADFASDLLALAKVVDR